MRLFNSIILFLIYSFCYSQIPPYYSSIDFTQSSSSIEIQLTNLISNTHTSFFPYTSDNTDTWDILNLSDEVISNPTSVYLVYGYDDNDSDSENDYTRDKSLSCHISGCSGLWNREHVFARSLASPSLSVSVAGSGTDVHNLRACDGDMNSSRSNRLFAEGIGFSHITSDGNWYPGDEWRGDVARIIMYMHLRYNNQCSANNTAFSNNTYNIDMPDIFLLWNINDPVSSLEIQRNNIIQSFQGNRNPFIDNPYLATLIWGGSPATDTWGALSVENLNKLEVSIYPTLVDDIIFIQNDTNKKLSYHIYNVTGQLVSQSTKSNHEIDVSSLESGLHFLKLSNNENSVIYKFLKK